MPINPKCPKCGSSKVKLTAERSRHNLIWFIIFGFFWCIWWCLKAVLAFYVLIFFDWWFAIVKKNQGKGYVWLSKRILQNKSRLYYCTKCGHNFRG